MRANAMSGQRCVVHQRMGGMRTMTGAKRNCVGMVYVCDLAMEQPGVQVMNNVTNVWRTLHCVNHTSMDGASCSFDEQ